ncbi:hypothetical protein Q8W71_21245 [Methylobacterium sp. NEAU 140]|uniref:DUF6883 domain-containing protein n=1 Tax=Methylobacterium sp. NEAU 140 TaxID=3064945 RepID=UPI0027353E63|nr:DUF6883 domain-containing protein [Methylobacterium sp. NEAU 140]MDP4025161.1 hypothetical protein [Methylobacterium sp. NEAU 140]
MSDARPDVKTWSCDSRKITDFLLKSDARDNKGRYRFFTAFGFTVERPEELARALMQQPRTAHTFAYQAGRISERRLAYDGLMPTPDGRGAHVRTIWNYDTAPTALFITVKPLPRLP